MNRPFRRSSRPVRLAAVSAVLLLSAACVAPGALAGRAADEWVRTYTVPPGGQFELTNVNGQVDLTGTDESQVEVRAERVVRSTTDQTAADILSRVRIDEDVHPDSVAVTTRGLEGIHIGVSIEVQYHVRVPDTVKVRVTNTNGGIRLTDVHGGLVVRSTNGGVRGRGLEGGVEVRSTNGGVALQMASVGGDPIEIRKYQRRHHPRPAGDGVGQPVPVRHQRRGRRRGAEVRADRRPDPTPRQGPAERRRARHRPLRHQRRGPRQKPGRRSAARRRRHPDPDRPGPTLHTVNEDKATRYHRLKRQAGIAATAWSAVLLGGLLVTGLSLALRTRVEAVVPAGHSTVIVLAYVTVLLALHEAGALPLAFYSGFALERRYGLSTESLGAWLRDQAKAFVLGLCLSCAGGAAVYACIRWSPDRWWLAAGALFALFVVGLTNLAPVVLLPLFYRIRPLDRESLSARLLRLAGRAGARVVGVYEWGLGDKTRKANAALTGLGATRRILVSDTMLAEYSDDEIEAVLAHELAHHVHGDIWKGIVFEIGLILTGFYLSARVLRLATGPLGLQGVSDVAGLPLLVLCAGAVSLVMLPAAHAMSRAFERRADRFAIELTGNPGAFISAIRRLGAQNLAEENPSTLVRWLFHSHPTIRERIETAKRAGDGG